MTNAFVFLAAGLGSRMKSDLPKVLHPVAGAPLLWHAMRSAQPMEPALNVVVTGHCAKAVAKAALGFDPEAHIAHQDEQLGTGHAVAQAADALAGFDGDCFVLYGDTPFIQPETLERMKAARDGGHDVVFLGFEAADPGRYGRLIMKGDALTRIVEFKDATDEEKAVTFCNSGVVCARRSVLFDLVAALGNENAAGEYYLTDIVEIANKRGLSVTAVACPEVETQGVDTRADLAFAESSFQARARAALHENGVTMNAPETVWLAWDTVIGRDAVIEANVVFAPGVTVESGAQIRVFSHLEGCHVGQNAIIGPYARLRPGAEIGNEARAGNFVEIKNATIGEGAKVNHLSYVGDAEVGEAANIGAGTITCNYDGVMKHKTEIGARAFIGSNSALVAPVRIGNDAMTGSGSVITSDVPDGALALARGAQVNKPGLARRLRDRLVAAKAARAAKRNEKETG